MLMDPFYFDRLKKLTSKLSHVAERGVSHHIEQPVTSIDFLNF
jgi:hypothetical protein